MAERRTVQTEKQSQTTTEWKTFAGANPPADFSFSLSHTLTMAIRLFTFLRTLRIHTYTYTFIHT